MRNEHLNKIERGEKCVAGEVSPLLTGMTQVSSRKAADSSCNLKSSSVAPNKIDIRVSVRRGGVREEIIKRGLPLRVGEATMELSWYQYCGMGE